MRKKFLGFVYACGCFSIVLFMGNLTKGVHPIKIAKCSSVPQIDGPAPSSDVLQLLNKEFVYLNQGLESFVFVSKDQSCVLKFSKADSSLFLNKSSSLNNQKLKSLIDACQIAYDKAREETALMYVHMSKTRNSLPSVSLELPHGAKVKLPIEDLQFVLQKKAKPLKIAFLQDYERGDLLSCETKIDSFLKMIKSRSSKGIYNKDSNISRNFGFLGSHAVELDFGGYELDEKKAEGEYFRYKSRLRFFLVSKCPKMVEYLDSYKD